MTNQNLHLTGTVHLDPKGPRRLDTVLANFHPNQIALEMAKNREDIPQRLRDALPAMVSSLNIDSEEKSKIIRKFSEYVVNDIVGYERKSCMKYAGQNPKTQLEYIDLNIVDPDDYVSLLVSNFRFFFPPLEEIEDVEALKQRLRIAAEFSYFAYEIGALKTEITEEQASRMSDKDIQTLRNIHSPEREDAMAENIRRLYTGQKRLVAVVGLAHLNGLQDRLQDLNPTVLPLDEAVKMYK